MIILWFWYYIQLTTCICNVRCNVRETLTPTGLSIFRNLIVISFADIFQHGDTIPTPLNAVWRISLRFSASPQPPRQKPSKPMTCCTASSHPPHSIASSLPHLFAASNARALLVQARIIPQVPWCRCLNPGTFTQILSTHTWRPLLTRWSRDLSLVSGKLIACTVNGQYIDS